MSQVLIVDDEASIAWGLERLAKSAGHRAQTAASAEAGLKIAAEHPPDLIVLDVRLPGIDGLTAMQQFQQLAPTAPIVVITAFGNLETAVAAMRNGAFDYLTKPFDLDQASSVMARALEHASRATTKSPAVPFVDSPDELLGTSPAMQEVFKRIALVAASDATVLITGESGTGKELVARALHRHSRRAGQAFVPVHLAALSQTLVESELFGHVRGAFTGAEASRTGLLELADGGTVFFDEAADIPLPVQVKLLRVLEQHELAPVGDTQTRRCDFRTIAATSRDLRDAFAAGEFRQDLYFRLATYEITLPPLRQRVEDIPLLAERFLHRVTSPDQPTSQLSDAALTELCRRPWRGNVRELRSAVEHGALVARGGTIGTEHLPPPLEFAPTKSDVSQDLQAAVQSWAARQLGSPEIPRKLYDDFLAEVEGPLFDAVLARTDQNRAAAAEILGIHRATLRKKLG